jgi:hypothetical protein
VNFFSKGGLANGKRRDYWSENCFRQQTFKGFEFQAARMEAKPSKSAHPC